MSSTTIDSLGIHRVRLDQRLADFVAAFKAIFGADINVDPDTIDGQFLGIVSEMASDADSLLEQIYLARSPSSAVGADLSRIVQLIGIKRNVASYSTATVTFSGLAGTAIPDGSLIDTTDTPPAHFQTIGDVTLDGAGSATGTVRATTTGPVFAAAGTISAIKTVISGWNSVTNAASVNLGSNQETDAALRVRRAASVAITSKGIIDGIYAALANIQGVSEAVVFENKTGSPIARPGSTDLPPNAIQCVVVGGLDAEIAAAIWAKASAGVTLVGATTVGVTDAQGIVQTIRFDRPTDVAASAVVFLHAYGGTPVTDALSAALKKALVDYGNAQARIGAKIIWANYLGPLVDVLKPLNGAITFASLSITTSYGSATLFGDLALPFTSRTSWDVGRVSVAVSNS